MPISCDPNDLATAANCFNELSWRTRQQIRVYLLCATINGDTVDCDPNALAIAATCFAGLSASQLDAVETYLLCQLNSAGGGGVTGPGLSTDNAIARWNGVDGSAIQNSGITIADGASGTLSGTNTGDQSTIYSADGTLSGDRTITMGGHALNIDNVGNNYLLIYDNVGIVFENQGGGVVAIGRLSDSTKPSVFCLLSSGRVGLWAPTKLTVATPAVTAGGGGLAVGMSLKLVNTTTGECEWS